MSDCHQAKLASVDQRHSARRVTCGCHTTQHPASPTVSTTQAASPATTRSVAPPSRRRTIRPLPVRSVQKSQPTAPDKCPADESERPRRADNVLATCDLARTTLYTLGPETMQLGLTRVDPPKSLTAGFYEVLLTLDPSSAAAWASFTAAHLHDHVAFIRDDLVLEAPMIEYQVTSGQIALTTQTVQAADAVGPTGGPARSEPNSPSASSAYSRFRQWRFVDLAADLGCRHISTIVQGHAVGAAGLSAILVEG